MASLQYKYPPPEIWDQILSEVTYYPGEFDARELVRGKELDVARQDIASNTYTNRFILYNRTRGDIERDFLSQLDIRRALVLVCRQWYSLAIRHLYGSVMVQGVVICKLANTITSNRTLGPLIKRLELKHWAHQDRVSDLQSVLANCPNLIIFYDISGKIGRSVMPWWRFLTHNPAKLRYAGGDSVGVPDIQFLTFVSSLSSLVALKLPSPEPNDPSDPVPDVVFPITLPNLGILDFGGSRNIMNPFLLSSICDWNLPKLHTVWVPVDTLRVVSLTEFWRKHGKKLTTIKIYNSRLDILATSWHHVSLGIESIGQSPSEIFPRLRQLIVLNNAMGYYPLSFLPSKSLEIYEVPFHGGVPRYGYRRRVLQQIVKYHMEQLPADKTPGLRIFRISNCPTNGSDMRKTLYEEFVAKHLPAMREKLGVRGTVVELFKSD